MRLRSNRKNHARKKITIRVRIFSKTVTSRDFENPQKLLLRKEVNTLETDKSTKNAQLENLKQDLKTIALSPETGRGSEEARRQRARESNEDLKKFLEASERSES